MRTIYLTFIFMLTFHKVYSQACGGGQFKFEFQTNNDDNLFYEITQVEIKNKKIFSKDLYMGFIIDKKSLKCISQSKLEKNKLPEFISQSLDSNNKVINNELVFKTLELYNKLYLLTVWNKMYKIQILVKLFGGCNRKNVVIISDNPKLISEL